MITGFVSHELHVILLQDYTHDVSTLSFNLYHFYYELFFTPSHRRYILISFVPTRPPISTSSFWSRSSTCCMWAKQAVRFDRQLTKKNYLQTNAFPNLVMVEQRECSHTLQRKTTGRKATSKVVREITA